MKIKTQKLIILLFLASPIISIGQSRVISGEVVTFNQFPVSNITITAKKAKTEAVTDASGHFEIEVNKKDFIRIQDMVFEDYSNKISGKDEHIKINMFLKTDEENMEKAVNSGYIRRQDLKYGIDNLWQWNNQFSQFTDTYDAIKYAVPESRIIVEDGNRGIQLRGAKTMNGSNFALLIVDGVIVYDATSITPASIISIRKLTSAQSAIYGARAGNGIITIETR